MTDDQPTILPEQLSGLRSLAASALEQVEMLRRAYSSTIDAAKRADIAGCARCFIALREINEALNAAVTEQNKLRQLIQTQFLPEKFQQQNVSTFTVDGHRVTVSATLSVTMVDKVGGMDWLRANNLGDIIQETVNASTLKATVKKLIEDEGVEPPEELFTVTPVLNTSVTVVKKKA